MRSDGLTAIRKGRPAQTSSRIRKKLAVNSMVGLWANAVKYNYVAKTNEPGCEDTMYQGVQRKRILGEFGLEQMILQYEQVTNACMKPLHLQILDAEHVLLAKMRKSFIFYLPGSVRKAVIVAYIYMSMMVVETPNAPSHNLDAIVLWSRV